MFKLRNGLFAAKVLVILAYLFLSPNSAKAEGNILGNYAVGSWKLDFGVDERLRGEYRSNFDFSGKKKDNGELIFQRLRFNGSAKLAGKYELFLEGMDLRVGSHRIKQPDQGDGFDLHQAYFRMNNIADSHIDAKIGRQELKYGNGRLIWAATWSNRINHFDSAVLHYKKGGLYADLFSGLRVGYDNHNFNRPNTHEFLGGVYAGYQKDKQFPLIEPYLLSNVDLDSTNNLSRQTVGLRLRATAPKDILCELELPYQFGKDGRKNVSAYAVHFDASRSFGIFWNPKITLTYNLASGDKKVGDNRNNTFVPLYQSTHDPYGVMDFFRWQNMQEGAIEISLNPYRKLKLIAATNFFWLESNVDSWYDSTGKRLRTNTTGNADSFVGQEASILLKYDLNKNIALESGYAHFFSGPYVRDTGSNDDADWLYFQFNIKI